MKLKHVLITFYALVSILMFVTFNADAWVWISFFMSFIGILVVTFHHLYIEKYFSPFISTYIVFYYLFFVLAPIIQIGTFEKDYMFFSQKLPYDETLTIQTNALIILFNIIFYSFYVFFKKAKKRSIENNVIIKKNPRLPLNLLFILFFCVLVLIMSYNFIIEEYTRPSWYQSSYSVFDLLVQKKVLFLVPLGGLILSYNYLLKTKRITSNVLLISFIFLSFLVLLFWFKNPLTEKRNALGPIYITLLFLFFPKLLNSNDKSLSFLFFSMVIIFPLIQILTHVEYTFEEVLNNPKYITDEFSVENFSTTFNTLNYDAFANISASMVYVSNEGLSMGYQLLSVLLFFVPRSIWTSKPISSGELIGNYMIEKFGFHFNNLSNPVISEGYLNFGVLGSIFMAILLAYFVVKFLGWLNQDDKLKKFMAFYFAIHLMFLLRGDLTSGFSYYIGTFLGVFTIPKLFNGFTKYITGLKK